ncbi:hypothetical protein ABIF14_004406 [Bradyrhizobium elkanii]
MATFLVAFAVFFAFFAFLAMSSSWFGWLDEYANAVNLRAHHQANLKLARLIPRWVNALPGVCGPISDARVLLLLRRCCCIPLPAKWLADEPQARRACLALRLPKSGSRALAPIGRNDHKRNLKAWWALLNMSHHRRARRDGSEADSGQVRFDATDWAWEFLRRNAEYAADWRRSVPRHLPCLTLADGTQLLRLPRRFPQAEKWGLLAFSDPALAARDAPVLWHARALKRVARLKAFPPREGDEGPPNVLADFKVERHAVIDADGRPLVLLKGRGVHVAVELHDLPVMTRRFRPVFELERLSELAAQTELLKRLQRFMVKETAPPETSFLGADERLRQALLALDESLNGKTYRQIATAIFGAKMVADEWQGPSQFLKDRTRRLVAKGTELMRGGYRDLLG